MMEATRKVTAELVSSEIQFSFARSSGAGGQNVNKVSTKAVLKFDIGNSFILTEEEKQVLLQKLSTQLTAAGVLIITSQEKRSQLQNKVVAIEKLDKLLIKAFQKKKKRKATKPSKSAVEKRISGKKKNSEKKSNRRQVNE